MHHSHRGAFPFRSSPLRSARRTFTYSHTIVHFIGLWPIVSRPVKPYPIATTTRLSRATRRIPGALNRSDRSPRCRYSAVCIINMFGFSFAQAELHNQTRNVRSILSFRRERLETMS
jgi:hypothetical protein